MRLKLKITPPSLLAFFQNRTAPVVVFVFQLIYVAAFALIPVIAIRWYKSPFISELIQHTMIDLLTYFIAPYFVGLVYLGISIWMYGVRRSNASSRAFSILTASIGLGIAGLFELFTTNYL